MKPQIIFKLHSETKLPKKIIKGAPSSGDFDDYAEMILGAYDVICSESDAKRALKSYGAWDDSDLRDHSANLKRLLWIAVLDCKDQNVSYWYMGE